MQARRLAGGGRIDRSSQLAFRFDGKVYHGYAGDTLASALLANGVSVVNRSFKYHRPRGVVGSGADEPNAIMQLGRDEAGQPNVRATQVELHDKLVAASTKGWPGLKFDISSPFDAAGRAFAAGFYYKTFMRPRWLWHTVEKAIRASAGFAAVPTGPDPDKYEHRNAHCDVLVVGAGPAGIAAALAAAASGLRVMLVDEQNEFGGDLLRRQATIDGEASDDWLAASIDTLRERPDVTCLPRSTAFGYYDDNFVAVLERCSDHLAPGSSAGPRQRMWRVRAREVILAQGAIERPLVFCNNDRPGVMLASAVQTYVNRYAVMPGSKAVVFTNNDSAYDVALAFCAAGGEVAIVDSRGRGGGSRAKDAALAGIPLFNGHIVTDVSGRSRVRQAQVARWDGDPGKPVSPSARIDCDLVMMSGGWSPSVHLHSQAGGNNRWCGERYCFLPADSRQAVQSAGAGNGAFSLQACLEEGQAAGREAVKRCGLKRPATHRYATDDIDAADVQALQPLWRVPAVKAADRCAKQFVDYQNDTTVADIRLAAREGYDNIEHVKRYTALGFGTDQGKLGNINGMAVLAETLGKTIEETGTTTFRPAYTPVTFGTVAGPDTGELYDPARKTAVHDWHEQVGAPMELVGQWLRPWYFPQTGEDLQQAVHRECLATRRSLGIMDASTLGKIDVQGRDAVTFLERMYTHDIAAMKTGRCAYGILLGEDGMLMDDGVMARLGDAHFYLTTTTGGAARVLAWLERWLQTEWPALDVRLTSLTDQLSTIAVAGPNARKLLQKLGCDIDISHRQFPFMAVAEAELAGCPVRLFRVSFSGELAFEITLRSNLALSMWQLLMDAGQEYAITPYGTETMHVLRAEKGFVIVGQDTDGSVTPVDLHMQWLLSANKDFIGNRSLQRADCIRKDRKQLVGLVPEDGSTVVPEGTQLVDEMPDPRPPTPVPMIGHVTSSYASARLGHPVALALLVNGGARHGDVVTAACSNGDVVPVRVTGPVFYDPKNARQRQDD